MTHKEDSFINIHTYLTYIHSSITSHMYTYINIYMIHYVYIFYQCDLSLEKVSLTTD